MIYIKTKLITIHTLYTLIIATNILYNILLTNHMLHTNDIL
jgi:hypothetical protein